MAQRYAPELEEQKKPAHALVERVADELRRAGFKTYINVKVGVRVGEETFRASCWEAWRNLLLAMPNAPQKFFECE
jgi:hypothetical protein